jgi:DNA-binding transcriptional MerR regulator
MSGASEGLSIREIARRTDLPESTLRYYRNVFAELIPTVGRGRNRRHPEEAVQRFLLIASLFSAGESRTTVRRELLHAADVAGEDVEIIDESLSARPNSGSDRRYPITRADRTYLTSPELEDLLAALLMRDRELAAMHRELLEMVGQLLHALGRLADVRPASATVRPEAAIPPPPPEPDRADEPGASADGPLEVEQLRDTLARERETVERLRKARLELERRVSRLEREKKHR